MRERESRHKRRRKLKRERRFVTTIRLGMLEHRRKREKKGEPRSER